MTTRSAVDTIRGYFYQFDLTITMLMGAESPDAVVAVECIEDVDIDDQSGTTAIQCKYFAKREYNHSVIKDAIVHMVSHFSERLRSGGDLITYILRGHFASGQDKLVKPIDVPSLKANFLTLTKEKAKFEVHVQLGLTDEELAAFLDRLVVDVHAPAFEDQYESIIEWFEKRFGCSKLAAESLYYGAALRLIRGLATEPASGRRRITQSDFISRVSSPGTAIFDEWFIARKGYEKYLSELRSAYFTCVNVSPYARFFLLEVDPWNYVRDDLKRVVYDIQRKWSRLTKRDSRPFCPYVHIHGIGADDLLALKSDLHREGLVFNDGYAFRGASFDPEVVAHGASFANGIKLKIIDDAKDLISVMSVVKVRKQIFQFFTDRAYFDIDDPSIGHVGIKVRSLRDILRVI